MRNVIYKTVVLPAPAESLFAMYLDPDVHEAITGGPAQVTAEDGSAFSAFGGLLTGVTLLVVRPRVIVQSWRSASFKASDSDSTLIIAFTSQGNEARIDLAHLDVPDHDYDGVTNGWDAKYFEPWRAYLDSR